MLMCLFTQQVDLDTLSIKEGKLMHGLTTCQWVRMHLVGLENKGTVNDTHPLGSKFGRTLWGFFFTVFFKTDFYNYDHK